MGDSLFVGGGVTSPKEARLASAGLLALQGPGAFDVRTGVLAGPGSTQLVTGTSDTGPMTVAIAPHVPVTSRGAANGPYIGPVPEAITKVPLPAAPGSNSRIDIVYEVQQDATTDVSPNATTAPIWGVLPGTASAVPVKPDLSTIPGAMELATVLVASGATSSSGAGVTITNTVRQTVARGARIPVRSEAERNALTAFAGLEVFRIDTGAIEVCLSAGPPAVWAPLPTQSSCTWTGTMAAGSVPANTPWGPGIPALASQRGGTFTAAIDRITPPRAGLWMVTFELLLDTAFAARSFIQFTVGSRSYRSQMGAPGEQRGLVSAGVPISGGESVQFAFYSNHTGTTGGTASGSLIRIGDLT